MYICVLPFLKLVLLQVIVIIVDYDKLVKYDIAGFKDTKI
ncbi:hypothetical protein APA_4437 [Pseudanabaena sp. lw0831]|nr:hypothetical protein APA_4437 [Pseudanabaena sp. lw0831]